MSTKFLLDEDEMQALTKLMLNIQELRKRKTLCIAIGIDPQKIPFITEDYSYDDFCTELIHYLNRLGYQEHLCKLCCQELFPILKKSAYRDSISILQKIIEKINCNCNHEQQNHSIPIDPHSEESKPESWFTKIGNVNKKLLAGGAILLMGLAGFQIYYPIQKHYTKNIGYNSPYNDQAKFENSSEEDCIKRCEQEKGCVGVVISRDKQCWLKAHINFPLIVDPSATTIEIR
jgi:hypothetical protein